MTIPCLSIDPFDEAFLGNPYPHHDMLREAGPVVWIESTRCYAMARFAQVQNALADWRTFVSGRGVGLADFATEEPWRPPSLLLEADPPLHDRTRGLVNRVASLKSLKEVMPAWRAKARALVDRLLAMRRFDAVEDLGAAFPLSVFPDLIGLKDEGRENLIVYGTGVFNAFGPRNPVLERSLADTAAASVWVAKACKRDQLKAGGWGMLVYEAADAGACTPEEAERLVRSFLSAGVDTTVNGIANMVHAFAEHPGQWRSLLARPDLARRAFEESLRWNGTVQTFFRTTSRDVSVGGDIIAEGSKVILFLAAANRDPRHWERAEQFDITRSSSGHVGFGFGIHQCLGQMVARMEAEAVLEALIERVKEISLTGTPVRRINNTLHAFATLPVEVEPC